MAPLMVESKKRKEKKVRHYPGAVADERDGFRKELTL